MCWLFLKVVSAQSTLKKKRKDISLFYLLFISSISPSSQKLYFGEKSKSVSANFVKSFSSAGQQAISQKTQSSIYGFYHLFD
jgi:hypothetical protein